MPKLTAQRKDLIDRAMRDGVFEKAREFLSELGWRGFTMDGLALKMGVSKGTLYNYFRDKGAVMLFINERLSGLLEEKHKAVLEAGEPSREILERLVREALSNMKEFRFMLIVWEEMSRSPREKDRELARQMGPSPWLQNALTEFMRHGIDIGVFRREDPKVAAQILLAMLSGLDRQVAARERDGLSMDDPAVMDAVLRTFAAAFCVQP